MASIGRGQEVCDDFGIRPVYVVDYPVAAQERGYRQVKGFVESGRAALGAHLHPWVNQPFWFGERRRMLGLPTTGAYAGFLTDGPPRVYSWASRPAMRWARLPAILSRLGAVDRLCLSPEGFEMRISGA